MIQNIVDNRTRPSRWQSINAIVEPTWHDNSCADADQAPVREDDDALVYEAQESIDLAHAITWANGFACAVTLYLYDKGDGTPRDFLSPVRTGERMTGPGTWNSASRATTHT